MFYNIFWSVCDTSVELYKTGGLPEQLQRIYTRRVSRKDEFFGIVLVGFSDTGNSLESHSSGFPTRGILWNYTRRISRRHKLCGIPPNGPFYRGFVSDLCVLRAAEMLIIPFLNQFFKKSLIFASDMKQTRNGNAVDPINDTAV